MITVILPTYNNLKFLKLALSSLYYSTDTPFNLVVLPNGCTDGTLEFLEEFKQNVPNVKIDMFGERTTPTLLINHAIKEIPEGDILLTQDDVFFHKSLKGDWLKEAYNSAKSEEAGLLTCLLGGGTSDDSYLEGFNWIGTWCMYIPRHTIDKIGILDGNMYCGDDIDYSYRVYKEGLKFGYIKIWHEHHQLREHPSPIKCSEYDENFAQISKEAGIYFKKKHGI